MMIILGLIALQHLAVVREREGQTDRQTETQADRQRHRQTDRLRQRHKETETDRATERDRDLSLIHISEPTRR